MRAQGPHPIPPPGTPPVPPMDPSRPPMTEPPPPIPVPRPEPPPRPIDDPPLAAAAEGRERDESLVGGRLLYARRRRDVARIFYRRLKISGRRRRISVRAAAGWQRPPGFAPRAPKRPVGPSPPRLRPVYYWAQPIDASPAVLIAPLLKHAPRRARRRGGDARNMPGFPRTENRRNPNTTEFVKKGLPGSSRRK